MGAAIAADRTLAGGFRRMPFTSGTLGAVLNSELLGHSRDPLGPIKDALKADGNIIVPIDVGAFGFLDGG